MLSLQCTSAPHTYGGPCSHGHQLNASFHAASDNTHRLMRTDSLLLLCFTVDMLEEPVSGDEEADAAPKAGKGKKKRRRSQ